MDVFTLAYYACVCSVLGLFSPFLGRSTVRFVVGGIVGVAAAGVLPVVRGMF